MKRDECSEQERWVLKRLEQGESADLKEQFGEVEESRLLRAKFLEALLNDEIEGFKPRRQGIRIAQAVMGEALDLENAELVYDIDLDNCVFEKEVNFRDARVKRSLAFSRSNFENGLDCQRLRVEINFFCRATTFHGSVDFSGADIGGQFSVNGAQFANQEYAVNFNGLKVGQSAFFRGAVFQGPVAFRSADIVRQFIGEGAKFNNEKEKANFNGLKVGLEAFFDNAVFQGPADFTGADIGGQFNANEAQFHNEIEKANFNGLKVGLNAFFNDAVFRGPVDFGGAKIGGQFSARRAQFLSDKQVDFEGLKVKQGSFFEGAAFAGPVALNDAQVSDLQLGFKPIPHINLERTCIDRKLLLKNIKIGKITARNLTVQGPTTLEKVTITAEADFRDASFQQLNFTDIDWPVRKEGNARVWLDAIDFKVLSTKKDPHEEEDWNKVLEWLSIARFNTQNYNRVDEYFQRCGLAPWAYKVFREGKKRGLSRRRWWEPGKYATRIFWGWLAGYGRKPARTLGLIIPLILIGAFLLEPQFAKDFSGTQSAFNAIVVDHSWLARGILSLDRFLPGVDLGLAKHWQPTHLDLWTWLYWYFLKIMGWITIPITLAAIYTKIK